MLYHESGPAVSLDALAIYREIGRGRIGGRSSFSLVCIVVLVKHVWSFRLGHFFRVVGGVAFLFFGAEPR